METALKYSTNLMHDTSNFFFFLPFFLLGTKVQTFRSKQEFKEELYNSNWLKKRIILRGFFLGGGGGWLKTKLFFSIEITILEATNDMHIWSMYVSGDVALLPLVTIFRSAGREATNWFGRWLHQNDSCFTLDLFAGTRAHH